MKVFAGGFHHETHCFSREKTRFEDFTDREIGEITDPSALRSGGTTAAGILSAARDFGWTLRFPFLAHAYPAGPVTREAFETLTANLIGELERFEGVQGVVLSLHGAMVSEDYLDAEGEVLSRVRAVIGPDVPLAVTLDLHANVSDLMCAKADILTTYRTTPHTDHEETAVRACRLLDQAMRGLIRPRLYLSKSPILMGLDGGRTVDPAAPMPRLLTMARAIEAEDPRHLAIEANAGFPYGDTPDTGPSIVVTADGEDPAFQRTADRLMDFVWETRDHSGIHFLSIADAVRRVTETSGTRPIILADYTDGPGGGAYADGTNLLAALLSANVTGTVVGPIFDPAAVETARQAGEGATVRLSLGGHSDPAYGGPPLDIEVEVVRLSDGRYLRKGPYERGTFGELGAGVRLRSGNVDIVVCSRRVQPEDREQFRIFGIDPETANVIACKGMNHFRADFEPIARELVFVDSGGLFAVDYACFPYQHLRRPIWPLDRDAHYEPSGARALRRDELIG